MTHEDFNSIELDDVLLKTIQYVHDVTKCRSVHWISNFGLLRVQDTTEENWQWIFASSDIMGKHMWSQPATDAQSLFQLWKQVNEILPSAWMHRAAPQMTAQVVKTPVHRIVFPISFESQFLGVIVADQPKDKNLATLVQKLKPGLDLAAKYLHFAYLHLNAKNQSYLDELTGLYNQRYLPLALEHEIQRSKRDKSSFTLLFLDIDYFKMVNDGRGHWVGSRLLIEISKVLKAQVRACDYCFRYGGDEFIVMLGHASPQDSVKVAERIRRAIEQTTFTVEGHSLNLTVSIGLAGFPDHAQSAPGLIQIADQAMYYGKRKSRNIVFVAS